MREPVASDQRSRPRSPLDRISAASSDRRDTLGSTNYFAAARVPFVFAYSPRRSINREPKSIVILACNFNQLIRGERSTNKFLTTLLAVLSCYGIVGFTIVQDREDHRDAFRDECRYVRRGVPVPRVRSIIHRPRRSKLPLRAGQLAPRSTSPASRNAFASLSPTALVSTHTYTHTRTRSRYPMRVRYVIIKVLS